MNFTSPAEVVKYIEEEGIEFVDVRFTDVPGTEQHFTLPAAAVGEAVRAVADEVQGPDEVRLVGAELEEIKALRRGAGYLVEWDIPAEITMDQYLARKKANAPKYAEVPETSFLRTYVREDTAKCLCFYDAPDEDAVVRAREAVSTPIDRIWALGAIELGSTGS